MGGHRTGGGGTAIAAGSQLSSIGALELGPRLVLAVVSAVIGLLAVGVGIWLTIDTLLPTQLGLTELADTSNGATLGVRQYIGMHPELLQGQATDVGQLKDKFQAAVADRDRNTPPHKRTRVTPQPQQRRTPPIENLVYLNSVITSLLGFAILQEVRISFGSWRNKMALVVLVAALAMLAFAWSANPPKPAGTTSLAGAVLVGAVLTGADLRNTDLSGADLRKADLRAAKLDGAKLAGVQWAGATCPDGRTAEVEGGSCKP